MRLINNNPDKKRHRKLTAAMWILILLVVGATVAGGVILVSKFKFEIPDIMFPVIFGGIIIDVVLIIIIVNCFIRNLNRTAGQINILRGNIGVCEHCGRFFNASEVRWKLGDIKAKTMTSEKSTVTEYKWTIYIEETCPACGTKQTASIHVDDLGSHSEKYVSRIWNNYIELKSESKDKSQKELAKLVRDKYELDLATAQAEIHDYQSRGFVIDSSATQTPVKKKDNSRYNVFLAGDASIKETVAAVLEEMTYCDHDEALTTAVSGGTVLYYATSDEADELMSALQNVGAKVSKNKI